MKIGCAFFLLLAPTLAGAQTPAPAAYPYEIHGQIGQLAAPAKVYLLQDGQVVSSVTPAHGRFIFRGTTPYPRSATLVLERQGRLQRGWGYKVVNGKERGMVLESPDRLAVYLEPGPVVLVSPDSLRTARVQTGALTKQFQQLQRLTKLAHPAALNSPVEDARTVDEDAHRTVAQAALAFAKAHPASWVSLEALQQARGTGWYTPHYAEVAAIYAALTPRQRASPSGQEYGQRLAGYQAVALGKPAPAFTHLTPSGQAVSLADYRGKYVLVEFWASWCGPCRAQTPNLLKAYAAYKARNFEVLGVSLDTEETRAQWVQAIADDHAPWVQVSDLGGFAGEVAQQYGVKAIPQNFLVDPSGTIVASNLRGSALLTTLATLLK
jgi:peroxiredoxin